MNLKANCLQKKKNLEASLKTMKVHEMNLTCDVKPCFVHSRNLEDGNLGSTSLITAAPTPQPYLNKEMQKIITTLNNNGTFYLQVMLDEKLRFSLFAKKC